MNAALAAANPTQQLSPRELVDMIRTWKARAEAAESEAEYLRAGVEDAIREDKEDSVDRFLRLLDRVDACGSIHAAATIANATHRAEAAEKERGELRAQRDKLAACLEECCADGDGEGLYEWGLYAHRDDPPEQDAWTDKAQALHDRARALLAEVRGR